MSEQQTSNIPEGYRRNAQGHLVAESMIKPVDLLRDELVVKIATKAKEINQLMAQFKGASFGDVESLIEVSAEEYDVKIGGNKGNVTLHSFDGQFKVQRSIQESITFDERLQAAKALIDDCLKSWTEGAKPEAAVLINDAFRVDQNGDIRTARVLALRRLDIDDERWLNAMQAIGEACQVTGSKAYLRVYERMGDTSQYKPISLDLASI